MVYKTLPSGRCYSFGYSVSDSDDGFAGSMGDVMADGLVEGAHRSAIVYPFKPRHERREDVDIHFAICVDNYPQLALAYGDTVANEAAKQIVRMLSDLLGDGGFVMRDGGGLISALLWEQELLGPGPLNPAAARFLQTLSASIMPLPISVDGQIVHVAISGTYSVPGRPDERFRPLPGYGSRKLLYGGGTAPSDESWAQRYRTDMSQAVDFFTALADGRVLLAWQPIRGGASGQDILYQECLLRAIRPNGEIMGAGTLVSALERLDLVRPLDQHVVTRVLDELDQDPAVTLGVNISAQSAVLDGWWDDIAERLSRRPDIARRLVIEITESAQLPSIGQAVAFADRMRDFGCRLAIDDFGIGFASIRQLLAFRPDILKIAAFFLTRASRSDRHRDALHHIVGLAGTVAPVVIAEGAETAELAETALAAGVQWQQGHFHGAPSLVRTWLSADSVARLDALRQFQTCFSSSDAAAANGRAVR